MRCLAVRKEEGTKIDPKTAETTRKYAWLPDVYRLYKNHLVDDDVPDIESFARRPGSDIWVWFGDLPEETRAQLWKTPTQRFAFSARLGGLSSNRSALVAYINDHFEASLLGRCAHCGVYIDPDDGMVSIFVGDFQADLHASCKEVWFARRDAEARAALGIEEFGASRSNG